MGLFKYVAGVAYVHGVGCARLVGSRRIASASVMGKVGEWGGLWGVGVY